MDLLQWISMIQYIYSLVYGIVSMEAQSTSLSICQKIKSNFTFIFSFTFLSICTAAIES